MRRNAQSYVLRQPVIQIILTAIVVQVHVSVNLDSLDIIALLTFALLLDAVSMDTAPLVILAIRPHFLSQVATMPAFATKVGLVLSVIHLIHAYHLV